MASRDYTRHTVTTAVPPGARIGDEYFNPSTNALYKVLAINGTTTLSNQVAVLSSTGDLTITSNTESASTATGALQVVGGAGIAGNLYVGGNSIVFSGSSPTLTFSASNPVISASSWINFPGGAYFSSGVVYTEAALRARGGIVNDTGTKILTIGSASQLSVANTTSSTSTTTGALLVSGGVGIAGNLNTGSTSINASLVGGTTSQLQINGDVTIAGANRSVLGNMFYQGGWKYAANGAAWGFREDNTGNLQVIAAPVNSSGALAAASPTYPITLNLTTGQLGIISTNPASNLSIGTTTSTSTATPVTVDLGGTYSSSAGSNGKLKVWYDGSSYMGLGVSGNQLDYIVSSSSWSHVWYQGGAEKMRLAATSGNVVINATTASTSTTTGALVVAGGAGIAGNLNVGGPSVISDNSANAALRITQIGAGNALLVEDSANPDSTPVVVTADGKVGVGTTTPYTQIDAYTAIASPTTGEATGVGSIRITNGATALSSDGGLEFKIAGDTSGYGAKIQALNSSGTQLVFANRNASAAWTERMRIDSSGNVGIGATPDTNFHVSSGSAKLRIGLTSSSQYLDIYRENSTGFTVYNAAQADPFRAHIWQLGGTEAMRIATSGNVAISTTTASTNTTTGALVVKGGAGIAGNVTAANVFATGVFIGSGSAVSGLFWSANNAAVSTGGGGSTAPGGSTTQIQYNNAGAFAGAASLIYISGSGNVVATAGTVSSSNVTGAVVVSGAGGLGVGGNVYVGNRVGYVWGANSVSAAYTYFNSTTNSIDTVFG